MSRRSERGASLVEYALLIALIALACLVGVRVFGSGVGASLDDSGTRIRDAVTTTAAP